MSRLSALLLPLLALGLSSCLTNNLTSTDKLSLIENVDTESNGDAGDEGSSSIITLSQVVRTNSNAAAELDLVGDGSGSMGTFCATEDGNGNGEGASGCTCEFSYTRSNGSAEVIEVDTSYREQDLIRCASTSVPTDVSYFTVRVHVVASDTYSNSVIFRIGSDTTVLNTADEATFLPVQRFQCKEALFVPYAFDGNFYDPFQSEDPRLTYPLNFFTTNMGESIARFVGANTPNNGAGFVCPTNTNDPTQGVELSVYSISSDGGSNRIFPVTGSLHDRANFLLARESTGVFTVPISALLAPNVATGVAGADGSTPPPLGFAAEPVPGSEPDEETCPDDVEIPDGYQWAKLWLFRSSLAKRKMLSPANMIQSGGLMCNPGTWQTADVDGTAGLDPVILDCGGLGGRIGDSAPGGTKMADRVYSRDSVQVCLKFQTDEADAANVFAPGDSLFCTNNTGNSAAGCTTDLNTGLQFSSFESFRPGSDIWQLAGGLGACTSGFDPFGLCDFIGGVATPYEEDGTATDIDAQERFDFLFVVSPPEVTTNDMKAENTAARPYIPFRFFQASDCTSGNPDAPAFSGDCSVNRKIDYRFVAYSIDSQGDAPADDPDRLPDYPVCVLQVAP